MDRVDHIKQVGDKLNKVGCGFCPMKWLHETLYLHTGDNHSCYHPKPQHIPLEEIEKDPRNRLHCCLVSKRAGNNEYVFESSSD